MVLNHWMLISPADLFSTEDARGGEIKGDRYLPIVTPQK